MECWRSIKLHSPTAAEAVGMVALTTVADIGTQARIGGGITHSDPGTMTTITNRSRPTTPMTRRLGRAVSPPI